MKFNGQKANSVSAEVVDFLVANGVADLLLHGLGHVSQLLYIVAHLLLLVQLRLQQVLMVVLQNVVFTRILVLFYLSEVVHYSAHRLFVHRHPLLKHV